MSRERPWNPNIKPVIYLGGAQCQLTEDQLRAISLRPFLVNLHPDDPIGGWSDPLMVWAYLPHQAAEEFVRWYTQGTNGAGCPVDWLIEVQAEGQTRTGTWTVRMALEVTYHAVSRSE